MVIFKDNKNNEVRFEAPIPEFIPYVCHYDASTLLTKNGELLQTIKIVGFSYETIGADKSIDLRSTVRKAILENIKTDNYALWFHTVRRKKNLDPGGDYDQIFVHDNHAAWSNKNYWHDKYVNELYITIIREGESVKISNFKKFINSFSFKAQKNYHEKSLEKSYLELNKLVDSTLEILQTYGARRLTILVDEEGAYSEPLQFFDKIIYLSERRTPIPLTDLSNYLATHKIAFGNNAFEVKNKQNKYFGAILSIKEYYEMSTEAIDRFLQLPQQFVITQCIEFTDSSQALAEFEYQDYILRLSDDQELRKLIGNEQIFSQLKGSRTEFGYQQLTITLIADNLKKLDLEIQRSANELSKLGIISIREDINMENCFWSQLPANFTFIRRKSAINTKSMGGFASLHNFPAGRLKNIWGQAVTLLRTALGTPYFFSFHDQDCGHTLIEGPPYSGRATITNFLVAESYKYHPKILIIDHQNRSELTTRAMNGLYYQLHDELLENQTITLNPLLLEDTVANRKFINNWLTIILKDDDLEKDQNQQLVINEAVNKLFELPSNKRRLKYAKEFFCEEQFELLNNHLLVKLADWQAEGKYGYLFDNEFDNLLLDQSIMAFDLTEFLSYSPTVYLLLASYLFQVFNNNIGNQPSILVINDAFNILNNEYIINILPEWLDYLTANNAILVINLCLSEQKINKDLAEVLLNKFVTKFYLPNADANQYQDSLKLSNQEVQLIKSIKLINRNFILNQNSESIIAELNLSGMDSILAILASNKQARVLIDQLIDQVGDQPNDWLPIFYQRFKT